MKQTGNDIQKKTLRRTFFKEAILISAGGIVGLNFFSDKFKLQSPKVSSTRVKHKRKLPIASVDEGFYINQKKNKTVIYFLSSIDEKSRKAYSPSLKPIPSEKLDRFIAHLKKIEIGEVNNLLQTPKNVLLNPVWTAERLSKSIQKPQFAEYFNFIDTLLNKSVVKDYYSRIKLVNLYLKIYKLDVRKSKYLMIKKLNPSEKRFLQEEKEKERKKVFEKYIHSK